MIVIEQAMATSNCVNNPVVLYTKRIAGVNSSVRMSPDQDQNYYYRIQ